MPAHRPLQNLSDMPRAMRYAFSLFRFKRKLRIFKLPAIHGNRILHTSDSPSFASHPLTFPLSGILPSNPQDGNRVSRLSETAPSVCKLVRVIRINIFMTASCIVMCVTPSFCCFCVIYFFCVQIISCFDYSTLFVMNSLVGGF